ncbi:MAG: adenylate/guanylate cyclase domain-containing protein [Opitutaceae bacterium]|jgi:class 3 adenylate cyclase
MLPSAASKTLQGWKRNLLTSGENIAGADLIRRAQCRQEYRMAWWRLVLATVPGIEAALDRVKTGGLFEYAIVVYAVVVLFIAKSRRHHTAWRWVFALGDVAFLQFYAFSHFDGRSTLEAAFAYVATANIVMLTNSLRLSLPVLWVSAAGILAGYLGFFQAGMDDVRVRVGGVMLLLICLALATMIVRGQLRLLSESRARARLRRFVSPEVADELERRNKVFDRPATREVTVMFVDIRGFTPNAESMSPEDSVAFLNQFFQRVTGAVFAQQGTVDKYIGDCVMALFGAPMRQRDDATRAVNAALDIARSIAAWNEERVARGEFPVKIGIGLNTSLVIAGAIGTPQKLEYTVIGDGVNVASRVCELTKKHPATILLTEATRSCVTGDFPWLDLGEVTLRGRNAPLHLYGLNA